jgi:hypothetical protein
MTAIPQSLSQVGRRVRLKTDVPNLGLQCGEAGLVCSTWFSPATLFEVEFQMRGLGYAVRAFLMENQIEADEQLQTEADA